MASLELKHIAGGTWYIPAPTNIGLYVENDRVFLIDSGNDKEAGRQINKLIEGKGWVLDRIINTHSNADHIGGNAFLQNKTGCGIVATEMETPFIEHPELEPIFLYGGYPPESMRNKFLMAKPSRVTDRIPEEGTIPGTSLTATPLPGHFFGMIGIHTPDNVFFTADVLFPPRILDKYHLTFLFDIEAQYATLEKLTAVAAGIFIPGHGEPVTSLSGLIEANRRKMEEIQGFLASLCADPLDFDTILGKTVNHFGLALDPNQYILIGSTIRSYLAFLDKKSVLRHEARNGALVWIQEG